MKRFVFILLSLVSGLVLAAEEPIKSGVRSTLLTDFFIVFGSIFVLLSSLGILRFPDFYSRLHSSSKLLTFGGFSIFIGAAVASYPLGVMERFILIIFFFFLTAPLGSYMIARAGYLRGIPPAREAGSVDQWQALGQTYTPNDAEP
jgi:multicomponent Na+:H+ antiporter subunit G